MKEKLTTRSGEVLLSLRFCPQCGTSIDPDKKFCTSCGASLTPDLPGTNPASAGTVTAVPGPAAPSRANGLIAVAGLIIVIIGIVLVGYPVLTGSTILSATGLSVTPAPTPVPTEAATSGSYVMVETIETPVPTTMPLIPETTLIPTTRITTVPTPTKEIKPVVCPSDRMKCDNRCVDLQTDSSNCGYCKTTCSTGQFCSNGQCIKSCSASQTSCTDGCFDLQYDAKHCGACLNACPRGLICYRGQCTAPATPMPVPQ